MGPAEFVALISALVSIASAVREVIQGSDANREGILSKHEAECPTEPSPAALAAASKITDSVRDVLGNRIKRIKKRLAREYHDPTSRPQDWESAYDNAQYEICGVLELLQKHNGGKLPNEYEALWREFGCDSAP